MEHGITAAPARFWRTWASGLSRSLRVCCARGSARLASPARCPGSRGQGRRWKGREADRGRSMPGATATPDVEVIVEDARGGGGGGGGGPDGGDGGDDGDYGKGWQREPPSPRRFSTGIAIAMVTILMFFMALASAFLLLHHSSRVWDAVQLPRILCATAAVRMGSGFVFARSRLRLAN